MVSKLLKSQKGMTLMEIMVVIAILGVIATMVTVNVMGQFDKAKIDTTGTQIKSIEQALDQYRLDAGRYPTTEQGLSALVTAPSFGKGPKRYPPGGYVKKVPEDAWGEEYVYTSPGSNGNPVEIVSKGPDREFGTEDDIKSWEL